MEMKQWPKDLSETVHAEKLVGPVIESLRASYRLERTGSGKVQYDGYTYPSLLTATCLDPQESLEPEHIEEYGTSPVEELIWIAFRLGYVQGWRERSKDSMLDSMAKSIAGGY